MFIFNSNISRWLAIIIGFQSNIVAEPRRKHRHFVKRHTAYAGRANDGVFFSLGSKLSYCHVIMHIVGIVFINQFLIFGIFYVYTSNNGMS